MKRILIAAAAFSAAITAARAADFVVIESSVAALQPGARISSGAKLSVPALGRVVLMSADGSVVPFNGPFDGAVPAGKGGAGDSQVLALLPAIFNPAVRTEAGAVRAAGVGWRKETVKSVADVLTVNASDGGDTCLAGTAGVEVMHDPTHSGGMTVHAADGDAAAKLEWRPRMVRQPWPAALPLADGKTYMFEQQGLPSMALATIHILPAAKSDAERVTQLAKAGCTDQARLLLAVLAKNAR